MQFDNFDPYGMSIICFLNERHGSKSKEQTVGMTDRPVFGKVIKTNTKSFPGFLYVQLVS